jgi:antitoxin component YwqK of YwqJK toxin-antitoxin module
MKATATLLAGLMLAPLAHAVLDCEINGQSVNPANGSTTAGKTGIMRCRERDSGLLQREQELKDGKFIGLVRFYQGGKLQKEHSVNEQGNQHGRAREFSPDGQLLREAVYDNGNTTGLVRSWHPNGQLRRVAYYEQPRGELAYAEFTTRGQLGGLRCGDQPLLAPAADDRTWCGFSATTPAQLEFFSERGALKARSSYLAGKRLRHETLNDNGTPAYLEEITGQRQLEQFFSATGVKRRELQAQIAADGKSRQRELERDYSESGSLTRERSWAGGKPTGDQSFYLNGQPRSKTGFGGEAESAWLETTDYFDSGKVSAKGRYSNTARGRQLPLGLHQRFSEAGKLIAESSYDERGRITREKAWDADGKLLRDDEVFEDGSRKTLPK